jgi:endonuclease YncB( thermonuclease family)
MNRRKILLPLFAVMALLFAVNTHAWHRSLTPATVVKVIDGDTLKVKTQGYKENIRLIGVDTPEGRKNKKALKDADRSGEDVRTITKMGKQATRVS